LEKVEVLLCYALYRGGNIVPTQYRQVITNRHPKGETRQKLGQGGFVRIHRRRGSGEGTNTAPAHARLPKGDYIDPGRKVVDRRPTIDQKPLSKCAEKLVVEYIKRLSFWTAIKEGFPVEWSGRQFLGVGKSRSHAILEELGGGPWEWFSAKVAECMRSGKIGRGRATQRSSVADGFFTALVGKNGLADLRAQFGSRATIAIDEVHRQRDEIEKEVVDYMVYANFF
jgi:hypothetical protein